MSEETTFHSRLKKIRKQLEISQKKMAEVIGISNATLCEIENGKHKPGYDFIVNIVSKFNVDVYYLLFGVGEMFRDSGSSLSGSSLLAKRKSKTMRKFIYLFERSTILQFFILSAFIDKMINDPNTIKKEIAIVDAKIKNERLTQSK